MNTNSIINNLIHDDAWFEIYTSLKNTLAPYKLLTNDEVIKGIAIGDDIIPFTTKVLNVLDSNSSFPDNYSEEDIVNETKVLVFYYLILLEVAAMLKSHPDICLYKVEWEPIRAHPTPVILEADWHNASVCLYFEYLNKKMSIRVFPGTKIKDTIAYNTFVNVQFWNDQAANSIEVKNVSIDTFNKDFVYNYITKCYALG